jgi:TetR/AcrR family transcriptional regulator
MNELVERRQEERERRRGEILDAAEAVAARIGMDAMTMDQVARQARLSRALIYVYFENKADLVFGLCERALHLLERRFEEAIARHGLGIDQVNAIGRAYVAFAEQFPIYFEALSQFHAHAPDQDDNSRSEQACKTAGDRVHGLTVRAILNGVADGSVRKDAGEPLLVAVTLWGFMHGTLQLVSTKADILAMDGISTRQLIDHSLRMCRLSLAAVP